MVTFLFSYSHTIASDSASVPLIARASRSCSRDVEGHKRDASRQTRQVAALRFTKETNLFFFDGISLLKRHLLSTPILPKC